MITTEEPAAWSEQAMYNEDIAEDIAKIRALNRKHWAPYAPEARRFDPFSPEHESDALQAAVTEHEADALQTYARRYMEFQDLNLELEQPTSETLARWVHDDHCPDAEFAMSEERLKRIFHQEARWLTVTDDTGAAMFILFGPKECLCLMRLVDIFSEWDKETEDSRAAVGHPLAPLLKAWFASRARPTTASSRTTGRIIPARIAMAPAGDRRTGKRFSVAAHVAEGPDGQLVMPGFQHDRQAPALPLAWYDLGEPPHQQNKWAPLALRLLLTSILLVPQEDRHGDHPTRLHISLRQLLAELYPGPRRPRPTEYWPRLMKASEHLDSLAARFPWYDTETGKGGLWRVVDVLNIPRGPGALDDEVIIDVSLPPGSENGPQVSDNLALWGVKSDRAYRALLNFAYWWHDPGVTVRKLGQRADGQGGFFGQTRNPEHYPDMTDAQLVQLVFPTSSKKTHRHLVSDARKVLEELRKAGEIDIIKGKPVPPLKLPPPTTSE